MSFRSLSLAVAIMLQGFIGASLPTQAMAQNSLAGSQPRPGGSAVWFPGGPVFVCFPDGSPTRIRCERAAIPIPIADIKDVKAVRFTNESSAGWLVTTANGYQLCAMQRTRPRTHCVKVGLPLIAGAHFDVARQSVGSQRSSLALKFPLPVGSGLEAAEPLRNRIRAAFHRAKSELESVLKSNAVASTAERSMSSLSYSFEQDDPPQLDPVEIVGTPIFEDQAPPIPGDWFFPETPFPIDDMSADSSEREECKKLCDKALQAQVQNVCSKIKSKVPKSLCFQNANFLYSQCLRNCK